MSAFSSYLEVSAFSSVILLRRIHLQRIAFSNDVHAETLGGVKSIFQSFFHVSDDLRLSSTPHPSHIFYSIDFPIDYRVIGKKPNWVFYVLWQVINI